MLSLYIRKSKILKSKIKFRQKKKYFLKSKTKLKNKLKNKQLKKIK